MRIELSADQVAYLRRLQVEKQLAEAKLEGAIVGIMKGSNHRGPYACDLGDDPHIELVPARTEDAEGRSAKPAAGTEEA